METTRSVLLIIENEGEEAPLADKMKQLHLNPGYSQRALQRVQLQHVDSLLSFLTLLRARWMIKNKQDPFNLISLDYRDDVKDLVNDLGIPVTEKEALGKLKDHKNLDDILFKLYLYIMTRYVRACVATDNLQLIARFTHVCRSNSVITLINRRDELWNGNSETNITF